MRAYHVFLLLLGLLVGCLGLQDSPANRICLGALLVLLLQLLWCYKWVNEVFEQAQVRKVGLLQVRRMMISERLVRKTFRITHWQVDQSQERTQRSAPLEKLSGWEQMMALEMLFDMNRSINVEHVINFNRRKGNKIKQVILKVRDLFVSYTSMLQNFSMNIKARKRMVKSGSSVEATKDQVKSLQFLKEEGFEVIQNIRFPDFKRQADNIIQSNKHLKEKALLIKTSCSDLLDVVIFNQLDNMQKKKNQNINALRTQRVNCKKANQSNEQTLKQLQKELILLQSKKEAIQQQHINERISAQLQIKALNSQIFNIINNLQWNLQKIKAAQNKIYLQHRLFTKDLTRLQQVAVSNVGSAMLSLIDIQKEYLEKLFKSQLKMLGTSSQGEGKDEDQDSEQFLSLCQQIFRFEIQQINKLKTLIDADFSQDFPFIQLLSRYFLSLSNNTLRLLSYLATLRNQHHRTVKTKFFVEHLHFLKAKQSFLLQLENQISKQPLLKINAEDQTIFIRQMAQTTFRDTLHEDQNGRDLIEQLLKVLIHEWSSSDYFKNFLSKKLHIVFNKKRPDFLQEIVIKSIKLQGVPKIHWLRTHKSQIYQSLFQLKISVDGWVFVEVVSQLILRDSLYPFFIRVKITRFQGRLMLCFGTRSLGKSWISFLQMPEIQIALQPFQGWIFKMLRLLPLSQTLLRLAISFKLRTLALYPNRVSIELPMQKMDARGEKIRSRLERMRKERQQRTSFQDSSGV